MKAQRGDVLSLRANMGWTLVGNIIYAGTLWGMLTALAKLASPSTVGVYAYGLALSAPILLFLNLQLRAVVATADPDHFSFRPYLWLRVTTAVVFLLLSTLVVLFASDEPTIRLVAIGIAVARCVDSISDLYRGLMQRDERMDLASKSIVYQSILSSTAFIGMMLISGNLTHAVAGTVVAALVTLFAYDLPVTRIRRQSAQRETTQPPGGGSVRTIWGIAVTALPLGTVMLLISLAGNLPRYFMEKYGGTSELGIYAALAYLAIAGGVVVNALGQAATPRLAQNFHAGELSSFMRLIRQLLVFCVVFGLAGIVLALVLGSWALELLYTVEYARESTLFLIVMLGGALAYLGSVYGFALTAALTFKSQVPIQLGVIAVTAAACAWLVPLHGAVGAAWAVVLAAAFQVVANALALRLSLRRASCRL